MTEQQIIETLATKVMGWKEGFAFEFHSEDDIIYIHDMNGFKVIWNPLQNIADAWQVVEKMKSLGWRYILSNKTAFGDVYCYFFDDNTKPIYHTAQTEKEAICMAALKVIEFL